MTEVPARSVYVLHGQDDYLRQQQIAEIVRRLTGRSGTDSPEGPDALAVANFDASAELSDVLDELRTAPFLAPRRVVILHDADKFVVRHSEPLEKYLAAPARTGTLILVVDSWPPKAPTGKAGEDSRSKLKSLNRIVRKAGELIDCSPPSASSLPRWITEMVSAQGKQMARPAARLLAELVGEDLARLDGEVRKLTLYVGPREEISVSDVSAVVAATAGTDPFALTNAIAKRDTRRALATLSALLTRRGEEIRTLGMLAWHVRKTLSQAGRNVSAAAKAQRDTRKLLAADLAIKTGAEPLATMQLLVMGLCS